MNADYYNVDTYLYVRGIPTMCTETLTLSMSVTAVLCCACATVLLVVAIQIRTENRENFRQCLEL